MQTFCGITTDGMLDYLAAIYTLGQSSANNGAKVTTTSLAEKMHVSPAAASSMLKRLEESGFVERSNVEGIQLAKQGELAALQLLRRHRLLEVFLMQIMGFTWDQVDVEAHRLEHAISAEFEERMDQLCGYPSHCPHGDPIPTKDGHIRHEELICVLDLKPGEWGVLRRIGTNDASILRYLSRLYLTPGRSIQLVEKAPFNGPITLKLGNKGGEQLNGSAASVSPFAVEPLDPSDSLSQILGNELAEQLFVMPERVNHPIAST